LCGSTVKTQFAFPTECLNPKRELGYEAQAPATIDVNFVERKPNLSVKWSPVFYGKVITISFVIVNSINPIFKLRYFGLLGTMKDVVTARAFKL